LSQSLKVVTSPDVAVKPLSEPLVFMQVLWAVAHGLESASKRMHTELGVTGPQRLVLRIIGHHGRISAGELAETLHIHPSSLTGMLKRLEDADMIRRESDPFDRRRALLTLSRKGVRLNDQHEGTIEATMEAALSQIPKARVTIAKAVLAAIAAALTDESALEAVPPQAASPQVNVRRGRRTHESTRRSR